MIKTITINDGLTKYKSGEIFDLDSKSAIIFGNNGSGKSSLSKLFYYGNKNIDGENLSSEYLSLKNVNAENFNVSIKLDKTTKKTTYCSEGITNNIYIPTFNEQYIKEKIGINHKFSENKIENVQYISETINSPIKTEFEKKENEFKNLEEDIIKKENTLNSNIINNIKNLNSDIKSNSSFLTIEKVIDFLNINKQKKKFIEAESEKIKHMKFLDDLKQLDELFMDNPYFTLRSPSIYVNTYYEIFSLVNNMISFDENDEKVEYAKKYFENLEVGFRKWKIDGTDYINENRCPFCESDISKSKLVESYIVYSKSKMNECISKLEDNRKSLEETSKNTYRELNSLISVYNRIKNIISEEEFGRLINFNHQYQTLTDELIKKINQKLEKDNININCQNSIGIIPISIFEEFSNNFAKISDDIQKINDLIQKQNTLKSKRQKEFLLNTGYKIIFNTSRDLYVELVKLRKEKLKIFNELKKIEKEYKIELAKNNKIIVRLNEILQFLNINDYSVDSNFDLQLLSLTINSSELYLSEGEKTAISFALFIAEIEFSEKDFDTIVIDDPISSLDYNRIYAVCTLIDEIINKNKSKQFLILTHNSLFYNILGYNYKDNKEQRFKFLKLKIDNNNFTYITNDNNICSSIYINKLIEIYRLSKEGINNNARNYIHNYCRYILETIYNFEKPELTSTGASKDLIKLLQGEQKFLNKTHLSKAKLETYKNLINKGSHASLNEIDDGETYDDNDYKEACDITIKIVRYRYAMQYNYIESIYNNSSNNSNTNKIKTSRKKIVRS